MKKTKKILSLVLAFVMIVSMVPASVFAEGTTTATTYKDGTYTKKATVLPDEDEDFKSYELSVDVGIESGKVKSVTFSKGNTFGNDEDNEDYSYKALDGTKTKTGIAAQIIAKNGVEGVDVVSKATCTSKAILEAAAAALKEAKEAAEKEEAASVQYALMNIPYAKFYEAEVNNSVPVDIFTSATKNKSRTKSGVMADGSYHVNADGTDITGITFPVKIGKDVDLSKYKKVTDENSVEITVTNRGTTTTTTYKGKDALFESASYSYYLLSEQPEFYKEVTVDIDGNLKFGKAVGDVKKVSGVTTELLTKTSYGDYQLNLEGFDFNTSTDTVYGIVLNTKEGNGYGLRHLENIWKGVELSWCTGFTNAVHSCPTDSEHYKAMMGQTINEVVYFTNKGIFEIPVDVYVPVKFGEYTATVTDADKGAGKTAVQMKGFPADFDAVYSVKGLDGAAVKGEELTWNAAAAKQGSYTLTIEDKSGKYAEILVDFMLTTDEMPAVYSAETISLKKADDASEDAFTSYLNAITTVTVNGKAYKASGKGSTVIINKETGAIDLEAGKGAIFAENGTYNVSVAATGYKALTFEISLEDLYVLMNIPYDKFYEGEGVTGVDVVSTATVKTYNQNMAAGSYHNGYVVESAKGAVIEGITYPVRVEDPSVLEGLKEVKASDSATITVAAGKSELTTKEVSGADLLFASGDYAYYVLDKAPNCYKTLSVDGKEFNFSAVSEKAIAAEGMEVEMVYGAHYTNIEFNVTAAEVSGSDTVSTVVNAIVLTDSEGNKYALRHVEDIWRKVSLGWNWNSLDGKGLEGKTITNVTYYLKESTLDANKEETGEVAYKVYSYAVNETVKLNAGEVGAEFTDANTIKLTNLPKDIKSAKATVKTKVGRGEVAVVIAENVDVVNGVITTTSAAVTDTYVITVVSENYGDISVTADYQAASETDPTDPSEPENPSEPSEPQEPTDPTDPSEPSTPQEPVKPENPSDSEEPATPENPGDVQDPTDSEEPGTSEEPTDTKDPSISKDPSDSQKPGSSNGSTPSNGSTNQSGTVQTGDNVSMIQWIVLMMSCVVVAALVQVRRRRNREI